MQPSLKSSSRKSQIQPKVQLVNKLKNTNESKAVKQVSKVANKGKEKARSKDKESKIEVKEGYIEEKQNKEYQMELEHDISKLIIDPTVKYGELERISQQDLDQNLGKYTQFEAI